MIKTIRMLTTTIELHLVKQKKSRQGKYHRSRKQPHRYEENRMLLLENKWMSV